MLQRKPGDGNVADQKKKPNPIPRVYSASCDHGWEFDRNSNKLANKNIFFSMKVCLLDRWWSPQHLPEWGGGQEDPNEILQQAAKLVNLQVHASYKFRSS